jgi:hypothetical protein
LFSEALHDVLSHGFTGEAQHEGWHLLL